MNEALDMYKPDEPVLHERTIVARPFDTLSSTDTERLEKTFTAEKFRWDYFSVMASYSVPDRQASRPLDRIPDQQMPNRHISTFDIIFTNDSNQAAPELSFEKELAEFEELRGKRRYTFQNIDTTVVLSSGKAAKSTFRFRPDPNIHILEGCKAELLVTTYEATFNREYSLTSGRILSMERNVDEFGPHTDVVVESADSKLRQTIRVSETPAQIKAALQDVENTPNTVKNLVQDEWEITGLKRKGLN
ncbi:MAG TPA: hypothetical protein VGZ00_09520 [Candidatus Baltobacteraceae bacterium]|nr:hypothetical protein [Candidatus Baltobacteraceae bacterium]